MGNLSGHVGKRQILLSVYYKLISFIKYMLKSIHKEEMKMKNRVLAFLIMALLSMFLAGGCSDKEDKVAEETISRIDFPSELHKTYGEYVKADARILVPDAIKGEKIHKVKAALIDMDVELIKNKTEEYTQNQFEQFQILEQKDYQGITVYDHEYVDKEDGGFSITYSENQNSILYFPKDMTFVLSAFRLANDPDYNGDLFLNGEEFSFASRQDAFLNIKKYLEEIGVKIGEDYRCYYLDYETMEQEEKKYDADAGLGKKVWSESDNAYYFAINQEVESIPVYVPLFGIYNEDIDYNAPIQIMYKASGIGFIQTGNLYETEETEEYVNVIDIGEIFNSINEKYSMLISEEVVTVTQMKLCWIPNHDSDELILAWSIRGALSSGTEVQMFYDAQTGKELIGVSL